MCTSTPPKIDAIMASSKARRTPNPSTNSSICNHSPSATLDLLILILVIFSGSFLVLSYFSYLYNSISILLHSLLPLPDSPFPYLVGFALSFGILIGSVEVCFRHRSRKCSNPTCPGLKKALEFDLHMQTYDSPRSNEIDRLPWKGGNESNPDYECLRSELRKMAPFNGRAILLFRSRCGCPVAKLEGWGPRRHRKHSKKSLANSGQNGDHR